MIIQWLHGQFYHWEKKRENSNCHFFYFFPKMWRKRKEGVNYTTSKDSIPLYKTFWHHPSLWHLSETFWITCWIMFQFLCCQYAKQQKWKGKLHIWNCISETVKADPFCFFFLKCTQLCVSCCWFFFSLLHLQHQKVVWDILLYIYTVSMKRHPETLLKLPLPFHWSVLHVTHSSKSSDI